MNEKDEYAINNLKKLESQINIKDFKKKEYCQLYRDILHNGKESIHQKDLKMLNQYVPKKIT